MKKILTLAFMAAIAFTLAAAPVVRAEEAKAEEKKEEKAPKKAHKKHKAKKEKKEEKKEEAAPAEKK